MTQPRIPSGHGVLAEPLKPGLFNEICDVASEGIYAVDLNRQVVYWNGAAESISGYDTRYVLGRRCADRMLRHCDATGKVLCGDGCPLLATMEDGATRTADVFLLHRQGRRVPVRIRGEAVRDGDGRIVGSVEFFQDLRQPLKVLEGLKAGRTQDRLDPLTGIGNQRLVDEALQRLHDNGAGATPTGIIFLEIDHYDDERERSGAEAADRLVREIALTIAGDLEAFHLVARRGEEGFVVIAPDTGADAAGALAERIRAVVSAMLIPHGDDELAPTISAGATVTRGGERAQSVVARAEGLLYLSRQKGRNQITVG